MNLMNLKSIQKLLNNYFYKYKLYNMTDNNFKEKYLKYKYKYL